MARAIGLMSGGLDSVLATRLLQEQGIEILAVCFVTPFFGAQKARVAAKMLNVPLEEIDFSDVHLDMVKAPASGYGANMNPCIDCHALMLKFAGDLMVERGYDFLFTGEVLGERPMSQNRNSLIRVAKLSGYRDKILRPLSALRLEETVMEKDGLVDREQLADISGRSRKPQMAMAERFGIDEYEAPAGGCLLTDPAYSNRLRELVKRLPECVPLECRFIRMGRLFWVGEKAFAVVGRRHAENERIEAAAREGDWLLHVHGQVPGATVLLVGEVGPAEKEIAAKLALRYSSAKDGAAEIELRRKDEVEKIEVTPPSDEELEEWRNPV